jgi:hypothetical protein
MKLVPENYKVMMLPAFFNYTDAERIRTILSDQAYEFIIVSPFEVIYFIENTKESSVFCSSESVRISQLNSVSENSHCQNVYD